MINDEDENGMNTGYTLCLLRELTVTEYSRGRCRQGRNDLQIKSIRLQSE